MREAAATEIRRAITGMERPVNAHVPTRINSQLTEVQFHPQTQAVFPTASETASTKSSLSLRHPGD